MKIEDLQGLEATHLDYKVSLEKEKPKSCRCELTE